MGSPHRSQEVVDEAVREMERRLACHFPGPGVVGKGSVHAPGCDGLLGCGAEGCGELLPVEDGWVSWLDCG